MDGAPRVAYVAFDVESTGFRSALDHVSEVAGISHDDNGRELAPAMDSSLS